MGCVQEGGGETVLWEEYFYEGIRKLRMEREPSAAMERKQNQDKCRQS